MKKIVLFKFLSLFLCSIALSDIVHLKCEQQNNSYNPPPIFMALDFGNKKAGFSKKGIVSEFEYNIYEMDDYKIYLEGDRYSESISGNSETFGQVMGTVRYLEKLIIDRTTGRVDSDTRVWPWEVVEATGNQTGGRAIFGRDSKRELKNCEVIKPEAKF